jgi:hypothetical protein
MPSEQAATPAIHDAIYEYFAGERNEMWLVIAASSSVSVLALWLFFSARNGFSLALMASVLLFAGMLSAAAVSLLIRDRDSPRVLTLAAQTQPQGPTVAAEKARMAVVLSKYKYYRYAAAVITVFAVAAMLLSSRGWLHGVAAGLLLLAAAHAIIDHYSERRAQVYFERLTRI